MKKPDFAGLLKNDHKIVENRKKFFLVPAVVVVLAIVAGIIYGVLFGSPFNLGMDFTGGYTYNIRFGAKLTDSNYSDYEKRIENIFSGLSDDEGNSYGLSVSSMQRQGASADEQAILVRYQAVSDLKGKEQETVMKEVNDKLKDELNKLFTISPLTITKDDADVISMTYPELISDRVLIDIKAAVLAFTGTLTGVTVDENSFAVSGDNTRLVTFTATGLSDENITAMRTSVDVDDSAAGLVSGGDMIAATVSGELLTNTILAIVVAVVLMLIYVAFRFEVSSGVSAIIALLHDLLMMLCFVCIFHIEVNATIIAAIITILGYSINNTIVIFDRIRERNKNLKAAGEYMPPADIANRSIRETLLRTINTTITTLITIGMVAIIGVASIRIFALPIIFGLIAGTFSSVFISPSVWAMWKMHLEKKGNKNSDPGKGKAKPKVKAVSE